MSLYKDFSPADIEKLRAGCEEWKYFPLEVGLEALGKLEALKRENAEWEKLVRGMADRLYAIGKDGRAKGDANGEEFMMIATELHRRCQIIKGEEPLPAVGAKLTDIDSPKCPRCGIHPPHHSGMCDPCYQKMVDA